MKKLTAVIGNAVRCVPNYARFSIHLSKVQILDQTYFGYDQQRNARLAADGPAKEW